jgi:hypothetical protein
LSFFIIARNWLAHHRMFSMIRRIDAGSSRSTSHCSVSCAAAIPDRRVRELPILPARADRVRREHQRDGAASAALWFYASRDNRLIDPSTPKEWIIHSHLRALSIPAVFLTSIPISFIAVGAAQLWWLLLIPMRAFFRRRYGKITDIW